MKVWWKTISFNRLRLRKKWPPLSKRHFQAHYLEWKCWNIDWFHCILFLRVPMTINQHWIRLGLGAEQTTSHYLNQCWPCLPTHICDTRPRWVYRYSQREVDKGNFSSFFSRESFWVGPLPMRDDVTCYIVSHWLNPHLEWSLFSMYIYQLFSARWH